MKIQMRGADIRSLPKQGLQALTPLGAVLLMKLGPISEPNQQTNRRRVEALAFNQY